MCSRIVITSFGSIGDVYPYIGLALGLRARGHDPVLAMPAYSRAVVEREGLDFHPIRPDIDPSDRQAVRRVMNARTGTEFLIREYILSSLRESYADLSQAVHRADLLVTHPVTFAGPIVAERAGLPWGSTVLAPISFFSRHDLPVFPPAPWVKRLERIPGAAAALARSARLVTRRWGAAVHELREELGLSRGGHPVFEGQHSPRMVLALFSRVLADPQPDWPPNVRITGAIPYNGAEPPPRLSDELEAFLSAGPPPVVFTLGSSAVSVAGDFYTESLKAVEAIGVRAVLLIGSRPENRPGGALPPGVRLEEFAPHASLFPRASLIVHQGGMGTLQQALRSGRPTLMVPFAHDQPDNAHRVRALGVSRTLRPGRYRAGRVADELRTLLEEPSYRERAETIGERVRAEDGVTDACDAIEEVLASG